MGSHLSKKTPDHIGLQDTIEQLSSYEAACQADETLKSFDTNLHSRTNHVINSLALGVEVRSLSFDSLKEVTECLLEMNQEVVKVILDCKKDIWKSQELFDLVEEYFENSLQTLDFCTALEKCLKRVRDSQLLITVALQQFDQDEQQQQDEYHDAIAIDNNSKDAAKRRYQRTWDELRNIREQAEDAFTDDFFQIFQSVYKQQMSMLEKLQARKTKLDKKLRSIRAWRRVSSTIFAASFAAVLICSVVAAAVATPPVAAALAAATALPLGSMGKWIDALWKSYEDVLKGEKEVIGTMQVGCFVVIKDLDNIKVLIDRLMVEVERIMKTVDFVIEQGEDGDGAVRLVVGEIRSRMGAFMRNVEELEVQADVCGRDIRKARTVVLQRIIKPPNN